MATDENTLAKIIAEIQFVCTGHSDRVDMIISGMIDNLKYIDPTLSKLLPDTPKEC